MRRLSAVLLLSLCATAAERPPVPRFTDPQRRAKLEAAFPQVTAVFEKFWRERGVPGMVFGVVIDGELALVKGFGEQDRDTHAPVTADSVFRIASMTKSFTALAILQLRDAGKLSLEDPVSKWIPEVASFQYPTSDTPPIRIRTLLTHGAGFPEDNPWGDRQLAAADDTLTQWLKQGLPFSTPPETSFEYSNYGFALLGRIVARVSGETYPDYIRKHLLEPLQLRASTLDAAAVPAAVRAVGYERNGNQYAVIPSLPHGAFGAMGGLHVSARDLARYIAFHLSAWPPRDEPDNGPVRRSSVREMQHPWRPSGFRGNRTSAYGYGLGISQTCQFQRLVSHGGGLPGFGSNMTWLPDYGVGMFVMANLTYTGGGGAVEQAIEVLRKTGALQPRELPPSPDLISMRDAIYKVLTTPSEQQLQAIAADNFFQDSPATERLRQLARLHQQMGTCRPPGPLKPENLLRGSFRVPCDSGAVNVFFTLAPTMPPRLQMISLAAVPNLSPAAQRAVDEVAEAIGQNDAAKAHVASAQLSAVRQDLGSCRFAETLSWNGTDRASVRLNCDRGPLLAQLELEGAGGAKAVVLTRPDEQRCAP